ncbi:GMC oxidoreductase [Apiospora saccharicola]|uniref:GMC oxidoreductase n=1 Tax=Apiospora saccharicola TaxID=335842 RepID=A0ABR1UE34_9PEZI
MHLYGARGRSMALRATLITTIGFIVVASCYEYDYVITGAGTAGLVVANRLSADPSVTVLVVEPGCDERSNPNVTNPLAFTVPFGTHIDWQCHLENRSLEYHQGKAIGGTSTINGMTYVRGDVAELDAWAALGNPGWDWAALYPYYLRGELFAPPTEAQTAAGADWDPAYHGDSGTLRTGYPYEMLNGTLFDRLATTWEVVEQRRNRDPNGGDVRGFAAWPMTVNRDADVREDAATAYLWNVAGRPNLDLVQGTVKRVVWEGSGCVVRQGHTAEDGYEAVVARGVDILSSLDIPVVVDLPGVGENLQDQPNTILMYNGTTPEDLESGAITPYSTFLTAADLFDSSSLSALASRTLDSIPAWSTQIAAANGGRVTATALERIFRLQQDLIFAKNVTVAEIVSFAQPGHFGSAWWPLLPFSRGSVHLGGEGPLIDPQYFLAEFDKTIAIAAGRVAQRFWRTAPMAELVGANTVPGAEVLPESNATDAQWEAHLASAAAPNHHGLGTAAMMSRDLGGVVDPELRVYGTQNVRVVDASVIPLQISGHLTATLYAVAERASDIIMRQ